MKVAYVVLYVNDAEACSRLWSVSEQLTEGVTPAETPSG